METKSLIDIHKENKETFKSKLINQEDGRSFACKVWDVMTDGKGNADNCLGENFNQLINTIIDDFFDNYEPSKSTKLDYYFTTYLLWLYLVVERIDFVFGAVNKDNKSKLFSDFKEKNFQTCQLIKKWANFLKHPKEFIFSHWPLYLMEEEGMVVENKEDFIIIDTEFVKKNYTKSDSRITTLENCNRALVLVPDLIKLTETFCNELNSFFDFICENKIVSDYLRDKTTLEFYYEEETEETEDI
ncbi:MAG: hypothetical protein H3C36_04480 [Chitinophagaceae bacterium]|nr:hypothetical protein [Chitinophagaceae bacterium]MCZ2398123.1 hypothetical protein [Chitinophagales bacterium]